MKTQCIAMLLAAFGLSIGSAHAARPPKLCASFAEELKVMVEADQAMREVLMSLPAVARPTRLEELPRFRRNSGIVDVANTARLKTYLKACGWPVRSKYGEEASSDAWLLVQHADRDPAFQREVLALLEPLVAAKEVSAKDFAYLSDRVAIAANQPQLYGTQMRSPKDCVLEFFPMDDREHVEKRRKDLELLPLDAYKAIAKQRFFSACAVEPAQ